MLYPRESETREVKNLSGIWAFKPDKDGQGRAQQWHACPLTGAIPMPVPASYNDITQDVSLRDHIGDVWYERAFFVPAGWQGRRVLLRFGSATHRATAWVNGVQVAEHVGGYLPFAADVTSIVRYGGDNRVTVAVGNILDWTTLPPGDVRTFKDPQHPPGHRTQEYFHDFFNYAGIHRPVRLLCLPQVYISDLTVATDIRARDGVVNYAVFCDGDAAEIRVRLLDQEGKEAAQGGGLRGALTVKNAHLWEPGNAYLYTLVVEALDKNGARLDVDRLPVGIRTVKVAEKQFLINGKPFHFRGFGKHEDMDVKGKGLDEALVVKDFNLLQWIGANSFRTSHYPYAEEVLNLADQLGVAVISESASVGMKGGQAFFTTDLTADLGKTMEARLQNHLQEMRELVARDKNHPCVVMWSVSNEPDTKAEGADYYFKQVIELTRQLDPTRPVTVVECLWPHQSRVAQYVDVICDNNYFAWYGDSGHPEVIPHGLEWLLREWHAKFKKPVLLTEFGADTIAGFHADPPQMWSEEYQCEVLRRYHEVLDKLDFVIGEHVWNFADFMTKQGAGRVIGNRKGVFTRQRQPKAAAFVLRERWLKMAERERGP
jgi:beta-glucuronidase